MFENDKPRSEDIKDGPNKTEQSPASEDKAHLLNDLFTKKDNTALRTSNAAYAELVPLVTLLQAPSPLKPEADELLIQKIESRNSNIYGLIAAAPVPGKPYYEFNAANPPGLYGRPGKSFGQINADPPQEYRVMIGCNRESFPGDPKVKTDTLWYVGAIPDRNRNLFEFQAADYHNPPSHSLLQRLIQYDHHDGAGPDIKFQGMSASAEGDRVGRNIHSIDIIRARDGESFNVEICSYPEWKKNEATSKSGWVPIRTKIVVGLDGRVLEQTADGKKVRYTQSTHPEDWRYDANAWKPPYGEPWGGPPK
jgi:hypothetical protein